METGTLQRPRKSAAANRVAWAASVLLALCVGEVRADSAYANGIQWNYYVENDEAIIGCENGDRAISSSTTGGITLPSSLNGFRVTRIGYGAFQGCSRLGSVTIPSSLTEIGGGAFSGCYGLTSIAIPNSVATIGSYAFQGCSGLTLITIPDSVANIGDYAFDGCDGLVKVTAAPKWGRYFRERSLAWFAIPNGVTSIDEEAFEDCHSFSRITIPDSVTSIGKRAFDGCSGLTSITIPDGVTTIGDGAFCGCSGLTSIAISNSVVSIGLYAFADCSELTSITIPSSVTTIGDGAFRGCSGLTSITIPDSVANIGDYAFDGCDGLVKVTAAPKWGRYFRERSLAWFAIPNGVTSIDEEAFEDCHSFSRITIPDSVTSIGKRAFGGCSGLTSITIPDGVAIIGDCAFEGCSGLTSIAIPNSVASIGHGAFSYSSLTSITIPNGVTTIGDGAFSYSSLTSITIPDSVMTLGSGAFYESHLETIQLPLRFQEATGSLDIPSNCEVMFHGFCNLVVRSAFGSPDPGVGQHMVEVFTPTVMSCQVNAIEGSGVAGVRRACTGWTGTGSVPASGTGTIAEFSLDKDSMLTWNWRKENRIAVSVDGPGSCVFGTQWIADGDTAAATVQSSVFPFRLELSGDSEGVTVDGATLSIPSDRPREIVVAVTETSPFIWEANGDGETCTITGRLRQDAEITIPAEIEGLAVTGIADSAFAGDADLVSVVIPDGVEHIGQEAFRDCTALESVSILDPDARIDCWAFSGCSSLRVLMIPGLYLCQQHLGWVSEEGYDSRSYDVFGDPDGNDWDWTKESIEEIVVTPGSQIIGSEAFFGFANCTNVVIPDSVTRIGWGAFYECSDELFDTSSIQGVKLVDGWAVGHTDSLSGDVDLTGIRGVAGGTFAYCSELTSITIPNGVQNIGNGTFRGCSGLTSVVVPNGVTDIGREAFSDCTGLLSLQIPNSVTNIGWEAFYRVGENASWEYECQPRIILPARFEGHTSGMGIPDNCEVVFRSEGPLTIRETYLKPGRGDCGYFTFLTPDGGYGNVSWSATGLPDGLSLMTDGILSGTPTNCGVYSVSVTAVDEHNETASRTFDLVIATPGIDWNYRIVDGCAVLGGGDWNSPAIPKSTVGEIVIPDRFWNFETYDGYAPVTSIGEYAFFDCTGLTSVVIPNSVTKIEAFAFVQCSELASISIPASVTAIGYNAFESCSGLTSITVDEDNPVFDSRNGCNAVIGPMGRFRDVLIAGCKNTIVPDDITGIYDGAFHGCSGLTSVTIPYGVTIIGSYTFGGCSGLTSVTIPDSVTTIGYASFSNCRGLTSIQLADGMVNVGEAAFANCSGLTSIVIPGNVTNIGKATFYGCRSLESIEITNPETTFISIGMATWYTAFEGCSSLKRVMIPGEYGRDEGYGATVFGGTEDTVKEIVVTPGSTRIGESAFEGFTACTKIAIPDSVTEIGANAFSGCSSLPSITIPPSVTSIGANAFANCGSLRTLFCPDTLSGDVACCGIPTGCNVFFYDTSLQWSGLGFDWAFATDTSAKDGYSLRSGETAPSGTTTIEARVDGLGTLSFDWRVSTTMRRHYARFYVDGVQQKQITGETEWQAESLRLGDGPHILRWTYEKSAAGTSGEDAAFLDNVRWSPLTLDEALDATNLVWTTEGSAAWAPQIAETSDGIDAAKSGAASGANTSDLATSVKGPGTLAWKWKAQIDGIAGVDVWLDGEMLLDPYLDETTDWAEASLAIDDNGTHRIEFRFWNGGTGGTLSDCVYLDQVSWTPSKPASVIVENVEIPTAWIEESAAAALAAAGGNYAAAATTMVANGVNQVWECYVAGLDPTSETNRFIAMIGFDEEGKPDIGWSPVLSDEETAKRTYTILGKTSLTNESWTVVAPGTESDYNFFSVSVEMK